MSIKSFALIAVLALSSAPVWAGSLNYADGKGTWQPQCMRPARPAELPKDPEAASGDLNDRIVAYNQYAAQVQTYLDCVHKEVERDAQAAQQVLSQASQKLMQSAQDEVAQIQEQVTPKKKY